MYVPTYLAAPISGPFGGWNVVVGLLGLVLFAACAGWWCGRLRRDEQAVETCAPWLGIVLFCVCCAVLTGISRVGFGWEQAVQSRYVPIPVLFRTSVLVLCNRITITQHFVSLTSKIGIRKVYFRGSLAVGVCALMVLSIWSATIGTKEALRMGAAPLVKKALVSGRDVFDLIPDSNLPYPDKARLRDHLAPTLHRLSLSAFRKTGQDASEALSVSSDGQR
ncbi:MAG: hypothetical protein ACLQPD_20515 [Desulfomonilaceae bacterium]